MSDTTNWQAVRRYARQQFNRLADDYSHNSHAATKALELAEEKFGLGYGVEGFCNQSNGRDGVTYINVGDPYTTTVCFRSEDERFSVGCWGNRVEAAEEGTYK